MISVDDEKLYREKQIRVGLIEVMIVVGGFIVAYSDKAIRNLTSLIFIIFIIFALQYYIFLTRTKNEYAAFLNGFSSSIFFSFLIVMFSTEHSKGNSAINFLASFIALTASFTFALLPPIMSKDLTNKWRKKLESIEIRHPRALKIITFLLLTACILVLIISLYNFYK